ncbi:hypothetical protein Scep_020991 [Stephania cephalantha]|uniref:MYND-type domain-containing protein n=1 Tax=Stephania cephalantha TaxID=152367 RepID=A0AAP0F857_9MAGN
MKPTTSTKRRLSFGFDGISVAEDEKSKRNCESYEENDAKRLKTEPPEVAPNCGFFEDLPDDLLVLILAKLSSTANRPSDFFNSLLTCKRLKGLGEHKFVLANASPKCFLANAKSWCESAHQLLKSCVDAGNNEARYSLGMIRFYCLESRRNGASLMAKAAMNSHTQALYSLAVIHFNGSGSTAEAAKKPKDLQAAVALCGRAASLGHTDALRELGHCLRDGYGVRRDTNHGQRFLHQANARELISVISRTPASTCRSVAMARAGPHPVNRFLVEWFALRGGPAAAGLRLCSHVMCGRPETRRNEFRRCSVCSTAVYCSRACQTIDWRLRHKVECAPPHHHEPNNGDDNGNDEDNGDGAAGAVGDDGDVDGDQN